MWQIKLLLFSASDAGGQFLNSSICAQFLNQAITFIANNFTKESRHAILLLASPSPGVSFQAIREIRWWPLRKPVPL
jgi:hypothetical protein